LYSEEESSRAGRAAPDFDWDAAKAGDGNLPGGVDPEALQKLTSSQEMMEIMSNPRLQVRFMGDKKLNTNVPGLLSLIFSLSWGGTTFSTHAFHLIPVSQELMKAVMSKDSETMQKYMADAEILQLMARFQKLSSEAGIDPSMFPPPPGME
jgi:hypothetical protein